MPGVTREPGFYELVDHLAKREELGGRGGTGVDQHRPLVAEEQVQERRFVVDRHVLPEDERVLVVVMDLDVRVGVVLGRR